MRGTISVGEAEERAAALASTLAVGSPVLLWGVKEGRAAFPSAPLSLCNSGGCHANSAEMNMEGSKHNCRFCSVGVRRAPICYTNTEEDAFAREGHVGFTVSLRMGGKGRQRKAEDMFLRLAACITRAQADTRQHQQPSFFVW